MKFSPATEGHAAMCGALLSDNGWYKVVKYGTFYFAYTRPSIKHPFGNSCYIDQLKRDKSKEYIDADAAIVDCQKHFKQRS